MRQQQDERQHFIEEYKKQKDKENKMKKLEKEEDLVMLRSYNPFGKPGFGAPRVRILQFDCSASPFLFHCGENSFSLS